MDQLDVVQYELTLYCQFGILFQNYHLFFEMPQVTFYEALKDLTEYGKQNVKFEVTNSFEGLVLGGVAGGMPSSVLVDFFLLAFHFFDQSRKLYQYKKKKLQ